MISQIYSLNGGEISRRLWSRADLARYFSSVATLTNFVTLPYGGISRRAGLQHIDVFGSTDVWLIPFRYSAEAASVLAFSDLTIRIYTNGAAVTQGGSPVQLTSPYSAADLPGVKWEQIGNVVFLVHPNYPPYRLTRVSATSWTMVAMTFESWPFKDENTNKTLTITPSGTSGTITLTASSSLWTSSHVNARWRIGHVRTVNTVSTPITSIATSSSLLVQGDYMFRTAGTWAATIAVQESIDDTTWETVQSWTVAGDQNITYSAFSPGPVYVRIAVTAYTASSGAPVAAIDAADPVVWGSVRITSRASGTSVTAVVEEPLFASSATYYHAEGSWSAASGYPRQVILHEGRLWFAGTSSEPLTLWASEVDVYDNFRRVPGAPDLSLQRSLYSSTADQIQWLASRGGALIVGTAGDEWVIRAASDADNATASKATAYGSADISAVELNDSLIFVERQGERMRDYIGLDVQRDDLARDPYAAGDLTRVAEHITRGGIRQMAASQQPDPVLWAVVEGKLMGLTYDRAEQVMGWHRHETDGEILSVATIPGSIGDEVWVSVRRTGTIRIERLHPETPDRAFAGNTAESLFLDAGVLATLSPAGTTVTGLGHLEGRTVNVLVDGGTHPPCVVSSGSITLSRSGVKIAVGLPMISTVEMLPFVAQTQSGSTRYLLGRIAEMTVDIHRTFGLEYSDLSVGRWYALTSRKGTDAPMLPPPLVSQPVQIPVAGGHSRTPQLAFRQTEPLPATILGLAVSWRTTER